MKKLIISAALLTGLAIPAQAAQAGAVAICIQKEKNRAGNYYDSEYFMRNGKSKNVDGWVALRAARNDHRKNYPGEKPYCKHNGDQLSQGGYFVLIQGGRKKDADGAHYNRWALGFGKNRAEALKEAKKELRLRDWSWSESKHGYKISDEDEI